MLKSPARQAIDVLFHILQHCDSIPALCASRLKYPLISKIIYANFSGSSFLRQGNLCVGSAFTV